MIPRPDDSALHVLVRVLVGAYLLGGLVGAIALFLVYVLK